MTQHKIGPVSPLFIVRDAQESANYYVESLGFELRVLQPRVLQPEDEPFFAMVGRDSTQLLLKAVSDTVLAQPNCTRHEWAPWDAFVYSESPTVLQEEFQARGALIQQQVQTREDGLTGIEVRDLDGYVLFFGHPS